MNANDLPTDISNAKDLDVQASLGALRRAAESASKTTIQTDTGIVIQKDGKLTRISAQELGNIAAHATKASL